MTALSEDSVVPILDAMEQANMAPESVLYAAPLQSVQIKAPSIVRFFIDTDRCRAVPEPPPRARARATAAKPEEEEEEDVWPDAMQWDDSDCESAKLSDSSDESGESTGDEDDDGEKNVDTEEAEEEDEDVAPREKAARHLCGTASFSF